jgi:hypothetical protein
MTWQTIVSAPKDGTEILAFSAQSVTPVMIVHWSGAVEETESIDDDWYERDTGALIDVELTHWMPLPAAPE